MRTMTTASEPRATSSLRGAEPQRISRRFWIVFGALVLTSFSLIVVVSFVSAANDNARIDRLKTHGVAVVVTVTNCVGNIGGSGSNAAGYTCHGSYRVDGIRYQEIIGSKTTLSTAGTHLRAVADPLHPGTIELASAIAKSSSSSTVYVIPGVLALVLATLTVALLWRQRSRRSPSAHDP
jgi:hypothetical protein